MAVKKNLTSTHVDNIGIAFPAPKVTVPYDSTFEAYAYPATPTKRYEYKRISSPDMTIFNEMGSEGWRLVHEDGRWSTWEREIV